MQARRCHIRFPGGDLTRARRGEGHFLSTESGGKRRVAFHCGASGFLHLVPRFFQDDYPKLHHLERRRHRRRLSVEGNLRCDHAEMGRQRRNIDDACLRDLD